MCVGVGGGGGGGINMNFVMFWGIERVSLVYFI